MMKKNGYQKFEERENLRRDRELKSYLRENIDAYNSIPSENLDGRIEALKRVIQCYEDLMEEAFDIDEYAYAKFKDKLNYLEFRKGYIEKYGLEEFDINEVRREDEELKKREARRMQEYHDNLRKESGEER